MITRENLLSHELIGLQTHVVQSSNAQIVGLNGLIVDETKFMFTLNTPRGLKKIPKDIARWSFTFNGDEFEVNGKVLKKRSYERVGIKQ